MTKKELKCGVCESIVFYLAYSDYHKKYVCKICNEDEPSKKEVYHPPSDYTMYQMGF